MAGLADVFLTPLGLTALAALIPLVLIMSVLIWIRLLRSLARRAHVERVDRDRARLDYMARRLVSLANLVRPSGAAEGG